MSGKKYDTLKLKTGIPESRVMEFFYAAFTYGAMKYDEGVKERNYKKVEDPEIRYDEALERHRLRIGDNEDFDIESGLPHAACMLFNSFCLLSFCIDKYKLDHSDLTQLLGIWGEVFGASSYTIPDKRITDFIQQLKNRLREE